MEDAPPNPYLYYVVLIVGRYIYQNNSVECKAVNIV